MKQTQAIEGLREWTLALDYLRDKGAGISGPYWRLRSWSVDVRFNPPGNLRRGIVLDQGITLLREVLDACAIHLVPLRDRTDIELDLRAYEAAVIQWKLPPGQRPVTQHGTYSCYLNAGCRREECRAAWATYMREYRATARQEAQERRSEALYRTKQRLGVSHG